MKTVLRDQKIIRIQDDKVLETDQYLPKKLKVLSDEGGHISTLNYAEQHGVKATLLMLKNQGR